MKYNRTNGKRLKTVNHFKIMELILNHNIAFHSPIARKSSQKDQRFNECLSFTKYKAFNTCCFYNDTSFNWT